MKCMDCGRSVGNWPTWLNTTTIEVRCAQCAGTGANVINSPKTNTPLIETRHEPEVTLEAA